MELFGLTVLEILGRLGLGLVIGFCIGLTGVGGGVLVLPALTLILRMNAVMAVGTASFYSFLTKVSATFYHTRLKTINWTLSLLILAGAVPVNFITARWISGQGSDESFTYALKWFITISIFFCIAVMLFNMFRSNRQQDDESRIDLAGRLARMPILRRGLAVVMGALIGALIAATSIGGGILLIPALMILFGLDARRTVGSSIFISVVITLVTAMSYFSGEQSMDAVTAMTMAAGSLIGVHHGSRLSVKVSETRLKLVVMGLILTAAVMMVFNLAR